MRILNCIIVDDEPLALDLVESYVLKTSFLNLIGRCNNAFEALDSINNEKVDLIFLDIKMPELNGLQLSRTLAKNQRVIFTTAYEKFAIEGFKVDALDYLLKPFNYEEFLKAANKAKAWFQLSEIAQNENPSNDSIFVKSDYKLIRIQLSDILFIEGLKDYVKIHIKNEPKAVLSLMSLKALETQMPESKFLRIHRSFIINLDCIELIERNQVLINKTRISIADIYKDKFTKYIAARSMNS
ncbi:MAG: LytTR family DNA-binding domain-containing protein [Bacteroidota bacterium]